MKTEQNLQTEETQALNIPVVVWQSEQLLLFAKWLEYNGKYMTPTQQVKTFIKEQKQK